MENRRLLLVVAETGHEGEIWVNPNDLGKTLKKIVVEETTIETGEQVLLCENGLKIEANKPLGKKEYHLFDHPESRIFVFDKNLVRSTSLQHRNGILKASDFPIEEPEKKPLDTANPPMFKSVLLQTVPAYENLFNHHVRIAEVHIVVASKIIAGFERCSVNLRNQLSAAQAVVKNLKLYYTQRKRRYADFFSNFKKQRKKHDDMLNSFESDLQALKIVQLHPELKTPQRETMLDCVPERDLRRWHTQCQSDHEQLCQRVDEREKLFGEIENGVEQETKISPDLDFKALHTEISSAKLKHADQVDILKSLKKDLELVRSTLKTAMSDDLRSSILLSQEIEKFEKRDEVHQKQFLPKLQELGQKVISRIQLFAHTQWEIWEWFVLRIKAASQLQNKMQTLDHKVALYTEGMLVNDQKFEQFMKVREMPEAYKCCLKEIVQRRAWSKSMKDKIAYVKETLEKKRSQEARRRKRFLNEHGTNLPQDFIKGLNEGPTFCEIRMYDLDGCLPEIDSYVDSQNVQRTVASVSLNIKFDNVEGGQSQDVEEKLRKEIEELKARLMEMQHNPSLNLQSINLNGPYGSILPRNNPSFSTLTEVSVAVPRFGSIQSLAGMNDQTAEIEELKKKNQELQAKLSEITIGRAKVILENENLGKRLDELGLTRGGPVSVSQSQILTIPQYTEIISTLKAQLLQERVTMQALTETNKNIRKRNSFLENMKQSRSILEISPAKSEILINDKKQLERELKEARRLLEIANQDVLLARRKISWEKLEPGALVAFLKCSTNQHRAMFKGNKNIFLDRRQCPDIDLQQPRIIGEVVYIQESVAEEKNEFELSKGEKFQLVVISVISEAVGI